jgi:hypothetical protein
MPESAATVKERFLPVTSPWLGCYHKVVKGRSNIRRRTPASVRQSVTVPAAVEAEAAARAELNAAYRRFMSEADPERNTGAGKVLVRAVFGRDAIADR